MRILLLLLLVVAGPGLPAVGQGCLPGFVGLGSARAVGSGCFQITSADARQSSGAMWNPTSINLNYDFTAVFSIEQCGPADGVVFVLHQSGPAALSAQNGGSLGYYNDPAGLFARSVAVELDTYTNVGAPFDDPGQSHVMLALNGRPAPVRGPVLLPALGRCASPPHLLAVAWSPALQVLTVRLDGQFIFNYPQNLVANVFGGNPFVTIGLTGTTGGQTSTQTVCPVRLAATVAAMVVAAGPTSLCPGGSVGLSVPGQPAGTTFQWSPATGLSAVADNSVRAAPPVPTTYTVLATRPDGCRAVGSIRVDVGVPPAVAVAAPPPRLAGSPAALTATGGLPGSTYRWRPAGTLSDTTGVTVTASPLVTTTYTVTATSPGGCVSQARVTVTIVPELRPIDLGPEQVICAGATAVLTAGGGRPGDRYRWSPATGLSDTTGVTVRAAPTVPTTYTVTVSTPRGGFGRASVRVVPALAPTATAAATLADLPGRLVAFRAEVAGGTPPLTYRWDFGDGSPAATEAAPRHAYPQPGPYAARLTLGYGSRCTIAVPVAVAVPAFAQPNIITPNNDGLNDTFRPLLTLAPVRLRVFSRWGRLVFEQENYRGEWGPGTAPGLYYYRLSTAAGPVGQGWVEVVR